MHVLQKQKKNLDIDLRPLLAITAQIVFATTIFLIKVSMLPAVTSVAQRDGVLAQEISATPLTWSVKLPQKLDTPLSELLVN